MQEPFHTTSEQAAYVLFHPMHTLWSSNEFDTCITLNLIRYGYIYTHFYIGSWLLKRFLSSKAKHVGKYHC